MLAGATGLEPAASCVTGRRSNQLNYATAISTFYGYRAPFPCPSIPEIPENAVTGQRSAGNFKSLYNRLPREVNSKAEHGLETLGSAWAWLIIRSSNWVTGKMTKYADNKDDHPCGKRAMCRLSLMHPTAQSRQADWQIHRGRSCVHLSVLE